jgi:hypothetical protein
MRGMVSKIFDWFWHGTNSDLTTIDWFAFVAITMIAGLLWMRVVKQTI